MNVRRIATTACLFFSSVLVAQQALDNAAVIKMVKAGLGPDVIVSMIQSQPGIYKVTPDSMVSLKQAGVSDKVLAAMAAKGSGAPPSTAPSPAAATAGQYDNLDNGVYYNVKGEWVGVASEPVNWKTGGFMKSLATDGIVKGDVNGHLNGGASKTKLNTPLEFLIIAPEGSEATDFQLVRLHPKSDAREFRTMTGGVFHSSGGSTRDGVPFEEKRLARHVYSVTLPDNIGVGEYAFLAPGLTNSTASGSTGKAYTFHVGE